jgi:enoyl-CoA hydratase/carnithine racemase|tara:strand:+ start:664 stop:1476 length:813 start_codon:yes stop_codon:yes gene_type:complete
MNLYKEKDVQNIKSYKFDFLELDETDHVFTITLDRPKKKNALHPQMINEIAFAMHYAHFNNSIRVVLFRANGDVFCSGMDLKAMAGDIEKNNSTIPQPNSKILIGELFNKLYKPKICQLNSDVYAGGILLVAGCNYVISTKNIKLGLPEVKRGIFPMQVMESLSKIISIRSVIDWCIRGYNLNAQKAKDWGLISKIVDENLIENEIENWINEVVSNSSTAIKLGLEALDTIYSSKSNHNYLSKMLEKALKSSDAIEGIDSFKNKRKPNYN